jgi:hypothetical protein
MAARSTMATLITKVRDLTNATTSDFSDLEVQGFLDRHRLEFRYRELCAIETIAPGPVQTYKTFELERLAPRMLEGNEGSDPDAYSIVDNTYTSLTPLTEDLVSGRWTFTDEPTRPVMITAWAYDVYAAAVDLLEEWAALLRASQSQTVLKAVEDNGQRFEWQPTDQQATSLSALANTYRSRMCLESSVIADSDVAVYSPYW